MEEMLSDPIAQAMMAADNVDPEALERRLRSVASMLRSAELSPIDLRGSSTEL
jgi:hypothetical protein